MIPTTTDHLPVALGGSACPTVPLSRRHGSRGIRRLNSGTPRHGSVLRPPAASETLIQAAGSTDPERTDVAAAHRGESTFRYGAPSLIRDYNGTGSERSYATLWPQRPLAQDYRFGHPGTDSIAEPRLRYNVFALLSRSILLSSPVRLQIGSGQGVPATPAATLPTPLRPCLSATPRSGCPALAALPSGHRQRPDPAQHVTEQPPVQMSLGQQQPVVAGMFDQTAAGLH